MKNKILNFPERKITHLTNEELIFKVHVKSGRLEIDKQGRIWRNSQMGRNRAEVTNTVRGQKLSVVFEKINGISVSCTSSRLVWLALKGRIPHHMVVTTKNGDKTDTSPKNLFLCTHRQSVQYAYARAA